MAKRTKAEIIGFLNSQVGKSVNAKCGDLQGQCVSLEKALLEFLGVPDPYKSRGNAKDYGNTLLKENIAEAGKGWLTVCINKDMGVVKGVRYGHIWTDVKGKANYEQNGAKALRVTKNTRPISQGQQFVNLDKWIEKEEEMTEQDKKDLALGRRARRGKWEAQVIAGKQHADKVAKLNQDESWLKRLIKYASAKR